MDIKYSNGCKEVSILFEYFLKEEELSKIPSEQLEYIRKNANPYYDYTIDETKPLDEQKMSKEAKAIIVSIYQKYFANDEQKMKINEIIGILEKQKNLEQNTMYGFNEFDKNIYNKSILKEDVDFNSTKKQLKEEKSIIKSEGVFLRVVNRILKIFRLK